MSEIRPGLVLADSRLESEASAYLQRRLALFYGVTLAAAAAFYVVGLFLMASHRGWGPHLLLHRSRIVHLASMAVAVALLAMLARRRLRAGVLRFLDGFGLFVAIGTCLAIHAIEYEFETNAMVAILCLFVFARAVVVPCSGRVTFLLSLPAPLGLLLVQLSHGAVYLAPGVAAPHFAHLVIWDQLILLLAAAIGALASHVNFGLRVQVHEAMRLGQYRLEELVGRGAMGEVYRASHAMLKRPTAIKVIRPDAVGPEMLRRFEREVRETSRLSHPNTVSVFDYGRTPDGAFYYAMEYLDGMDLRRIVEEKGPLPPARAIHILAQACGALAEAHAEGLVHRDLKPGNLVLCRRGGMHDVVKVVDFGLVRDVTAAPDLTGTGVLCGTPETIAPEVLRGEPATASADLYALGVVGYFLLTGKPIFDAATALELIGHHMHTPPVPPRARLAEVPEDLETVILRCLRKEPSERFPDAGALRAALLACAAAGRWTEADAARWWRDHAKGGAPMASPQ
ncbi:MAG: serine/threonine protein kinase [Planctomycetes bacterium]|nr:serine/threonine protein kinase [Planctomycetota bacterium]